MKNNKINEPSFLMVLFITLLMALVPFAQPAGKVMELLPIASAATINPTVGSEEVEEQDLPANESIASDVSDPIDIPSGEESDSAFTEENTASGEIAPDVSTIEEPLQITTPSNPVEILAPVEEDIVIPEDNETSDESTPDVITNEERALNTAPVVTISSPTNGITVTQGERVSFSGISVDNEEGTLNIAWTSSIAGDIGTGNDFSLTSLSAGTHKVIATVTDSQGVTGTAEVIITIEPLKITPSEPIDNLQDGGTTVVLPDEDATPPESAPDLNVNEEIALNTAPVVIISSPIEGAAVVQGESVTFSGTAVDNEEGTLVIRWTSSIAGELGIGNELTITNLSEGNHIVTATATDRHGLTASAEVNLIITVLSQEPSEVIENSTDEGPVLALAPESMLLAASVYYPDLINDIWTWDFVIGSTEYPSPDPADITYVPTSNTFWIVDSEVEEMDIYKGYNMFEMGMDGYLVSVASTKRFSNEPTGITYNILNNHLYFTDDDSMKVFEMDRGPDLLYGTSDDVITSFATGDLGIGDPEDIAFDPNTNSLIISNGQFNEVYRISVGFNGIFDGNDDVTYFSTDDLGIDDVEGVEFNVITNHLYLAGRNTSIVAEVTQSGSLVNTFDLSDTPGLYFSGLGIGPSSADQTKTVMYVSDRMLDNDHPDENDGRIYEVSLPATTANKAPNITISSPLGGAIYSIGSAITFTGTVTDDYNTSLPIVWTSSRDGQLGIGKSLSKTNLSVGTHTITASTVDSQGLKASKSVAIVVTTETVNAAPIVTITSPTSGSSYTSGTSIAFKATVTDDKDSGLAISWTSSINGQLGTGTSLSTAALSVGTHTITASAKDSQGLIGNATITVTVISVNTAPVVTITSPTIGSSYTSGTSIAFKATVTDDKDSGLAISWMSSINGQLGTGTSLSTAALSVGTHTITASAKDSQGLIGNATITVTVTSSGTIPGNFTSTMINDIRTFDFPIPSPDPSDITYNSKTGTFWIVDSEVDEMSIYQRVNLYEMDMDGHIISTGNTTKFSYEPTGIAYNAINDNLFFTDDDAKKIFEVNRGPDLLYGTSDDVISSFRTSVFGSNDPEDIAFDSATGTMFIVDGWNSKVYQITSGVNSKFDGIDDIVTQFDTVALGVPDPEGIGFNSITGNLYLVGAPKTIVAESTKWGSLVRTIDISVASGKALGGLGIGPSSANPTETVMYVTDRRVDNDVNPNENDGRIYELNLPSSSPSVNTAPVVTITSPTSGSSYTSGTSIVFKATVTDDKDSGLAISWMSSINGQLGTGTSLSTAALSVGTHTITASAKDSQGLTGTKQIVITVNASSGTSKPQLMNTIDASKFTTPIPDPTDIAYIESTNRLLIVDSEVDEFDGYAAFNLFEMELDGTFVRAGSTSKFTNEATGVAYNANNNNLFFSDDDAKKIFEMNRGADLLYGTSDDIVTSFSTSSFGATDPEAITYDPDSNSLFIADSNSEIYRVVAGNNGKFDGIDDVVTHFDTSVLGISKPLGISYNSATGNLYLIGKMATSIIVVTKAGLLVHKLDITVAGSLYPSGLTIGPSSTNSASTVMYMVDSGIDVEPNENDGKIYELSMP